MLTGFFKNDELKFELDGAFTCPLSACNPTFGCTCSWLYYLLFMSEYGLRQ